MKNFLFYLGLAAIAFSCSDDDANDTVPVSGNNVLLLQVDYTTLAFEGGRELNFPDASAFTISHEYNSPGDFGDITLFYEEVNDTIFSGTIVWNGEGEMTYPESMETASSFSTGATLAMPPLSDFNYIDYMSENSEQPIVQEVDYEAIWDAIDDLDKVAEYRASNPNAKIQVMLYARSVGVFVPHVADWIVIIKN